MIGEYDMTDRSLDSIAVRMSRKFAPGYSEKREREIAELEEVKHIRELIEREVENRDESESVAEEMRHIRELLEHEIQARSDGEEYTAYGEEDDASYDDEAENRYLEDVEDAQQEETAVHNES